MNILVFGHMNCPGGAQKALRKLVRLLVRRHRVELVLPEGGNGSESTHYRAQGLPCHTLNSASALPHLTPALLGLSGQDIEAVARALKMERFDLVISNTLVGLVGALLAIQARIPHLFYVHEYLADEELLPTCITRESYLALIAEASDGLLTCSRCVASQFPQSLPTEVLAPHEFADEHTPPHVWSPTAPLAIQTIGVQTVRKNARFGLVLCKALRLRGLEVEYHIVGQQANATSTLTAEARRRAVPGVWLHPNVEDPYAINAGKRALTLIAATSEPYGLTIPESLQRSVPVVASRSGGPQELLCEDSLYAIEDLEGCARAVMRVARDYGTASAGAAARYRELVDAARGEDDRVERLIEQVVSAGARCGASSLRDGLDAFRVFRGAAPAADTLAHNIGTVARQLGTEVSDVEVTRLIERERAAPGSSLIADISRFDVIPFCYSGGMDSLYRDGLGMAVELAANAEDQAHLLMSAYVLSVLLEMRRARARNPHVLALGDGLGLDAIRLARCGFAVDYADFNASATARVAALNCAAALREGRDKVRFVKAAEKTYDAVVCLEVAEHVPDAVKFVRGLAERLEPHGLLFLSECFDGVEDRWPTHLYDNELLSHRLPYLVGDVLRCVGVNRVPFAKPYVFARHDGSGYRQAVDQRILFQASTAAMARLAR